MYCSTCGVVVADGLSYCNHCGARIITSNNDNAATSSAVKPELLVRAIVTTFVVGLLAITVLLGVMKAVLGLESGQIMGFAVMSFLMMMFLEGVFLRLLLRRNRGGEERATKELAAGHTTKELGQPQVQALREPLTSVTDQTTRTFEPIYTKRNKTT